MEELKACPFCSGECEGESWTDLGGKMGPECQECGAEAASVELWNTRAPQSEWISVDKAPLNKEVLFFVNGGVGHMIGFKSAGSHKFIADNNKYYSANVLGWMPLPSPPKD